MGVPLIKTIKLKSRLSQLDLYFIKEDTFEKISGVVTFKF